MSSTVILRAALLPVLALAACGRAPESAHADAPAPVIGRTVPVLDTAVAAHYEASGVAFPVAEATLSTKLMGTVTAVLVTEGMRVAAGTPLVRIDAADLDAKGVQADAGIAAAEAAYGEARAQALRIRALYADSAAARAQLDAVEAGLARAKAGLAAAAAGKAELSAVRGYGVVRAPFAGVVTRRFVDAGDFAAPGAPLVTVQDLSRLRVAAAIPASYAGAVARGATLRVRIEGVEARAVVEGVVPSGAAMYTVNAIVANATGTFPSGGAATVQLPRGGTERLLLVPASAIVREGDLTGVRVVVAGRAEQRWVRLGAAHGDRVAVLSGLAAGDTVVISPAGR